MLTRTRLHRVENKATIRGEKQHQNPHQHMMPGLIDPLVDHFDSHPTLTPRGVARDKDVAETFVVGAILRDMKREIDELRRIVGLRVQPSFGVIDGGRGRRTA